MLYFVKKNLGLINLTKEKHLGQEHIFASI